MTNHKSKNTPPRVDRALLLFLERGPSVAKGDNPAAIRLKSGADTLTVPASVLSRLASAGLLVRGTHQLALSKAGRELADALAKRPDLEVAELPGNGGNTYEPQLVMVNSAESPLAALQARKSAGAPSFLTPMEFEAGERVRSDFTRAMLMPRISANWQASVSAGRRTGDSNGTEELTNSALSARMRFEAAMAGLGHDLSGVVCDICCFLKGFEQVEMERKWPKRSAKFMLKAGLAVLALHYCPQAQTNPKMRRWGASDYRPSIR